MGFLTFLFIYIFDFPQILGACILGACIPWGGGREGWEAGLQAVCTYMQSINFLKR